MIRRKLRSWVKAIILLVVGALIGITIYQFFTIKEIKQTPVGSYRCYGGIIKFCISSNEVANYLGV